MKTLILRTVFVVAAVGWLSSNTANATFMTSNIVVANPFTPALVSFGTVKITETATANKLQFEINVNDAFGPTRDVHQFGFNLSGFSGSLSPTLVNPGSGFSITMTQNDKIAANGNGTFSWVADFGSGSPAVEPLTFALTGTTTFNLNNFNAGILTAGNMDSATQSDVNTNFGVHLQGTIGNGVFVNGVEGNSYALGGFYGPQMADVVPEPSSILIWLSASVCGVGYSAFRKRKNVVAM